MARAHPSTEELVRRARAGDESALGALLGAHRDRLLRSARPLLDPALRRRVSSSDVVQETLLHACRGFADFAGTGEAELAAWLQKILVRIVADQGDFHHAERRDVRRERRLEAALTRSAHELLHALAAPVDSPSAAAIELEDADALAEALERLPPEYRAVFVARTVEGTPVAEIAARMGRSPNAVRMLWGRAVLKLARILEASS